MKALIICAASILLLTTTSNSQGCDGYFLLQKGKTIEMTSYNKRGKPISYNTYIVKSAQQAGGTTSAKIDVVSKDDNQKELAAGEINIECNGGVYKMDMKSLIPAAQLKQLGEVNSDVNFYIDFPSNMQTGDNLKDATLDLEVDNSGIKMAINMVITDRKVGAKENVTTPAGTWDCYKITSLITLKMKVAGIGIPSKIETVEYYAPGVGIVRNENKNGKSEITSIK